MRRSIAFAVSAIILAFVLTATAEEVPMTWLMTNVNSRAVVVELSSQTRDARWPGGGKVYLLEPSERKSVPIDCQGGEKICYGAWLNGNDRVTWGIGPDGDEACEDCCALCAKSTEEIAVGR